MFTDFATRGMEDRTNLVTPGDGNLDRILIQTNASTLNWKPIPAVILNASQSYKVAWMANFTEGSRYVQASTGDDERLLLLSLILWASDKRTYSVMNPELRMGTRASYINAVNNDMFEVYKFNFGLGYPF
jgi:hypothetical protein